MVGSTCDKICAYTENGPHGPMPYLAIMKGNEFVAKIPAWHVDIFYMEKDSHEEEQ